MTSFKTRYPDFASIEYHIRQAHAERSVAIATAFADGLIALFRGIGRLAGKASGFIAAKDPVAREAARI